MGTFVSLVLVEIIISFVHYIIMYKTISKWQDAE